MPETRTTKRERRFPLRWIAWSDTRPYCHCFEAHVTPNEYAKFNKIMNREGLTAAYDYAFRVGRPSIDYMAKTEARHA